MSNISPISEWRRIFIDTSFIIDLLRDLSLMDSNDHKYNCVKNSQGLLEYFKAAAENHQLKVRWITSSIVLSELTKFDNDEVVTGLQALLNSSEVEIINFTPKEANFIVKDMVSYVEGKHISQFVNKMQKDLANAGVFNPKGFVTSDALIIACAKSKRCDVVLTSDKNSFMPIAKKVQLPVLYSADIPVDMFGEVEVNLPIKLS